MKSIDIDGESLKRIGQWLWPRKKLAGTLIALFQGGADVVAFDAVVAERGRISADEAVPVWLGLKPDRVLVRWKDFTNTILQPNKI